MATLKDVANLANVDPSTVSRVLHGKANVGVETRTRIVDAAERLQYQVNAAARTLRTRVSGALGLVIPDVENPAYGQIIAGAELAARRRGFSIFLLNASSQPDLDVYLTTIREGRLDGLIVASAHLDDGFVAQLERQRLPYVLVNRRTTGDAPYIVADDAEAARLQIEHLLELGHAEIGYLSGHLDLDSAVTRLEGARGAFGTLRRELPFAECEYSGERVAEGVDRLFAQNSRLTAIAAANFLIAMAAIRALHARGKRVPHDISIIGQDDTPLAGLCLPGITTIGTQLRLIGGRAAELLIARLHGDEIRSEILKDPAPYLVRRESTAPPRSVR